MLNLIINAIINGILLGGVYALLAIGLNLLLGVLKLIHLAYGQFVMIGLYTVSYTHLTLPTNREV